MGHNEEKLWHGGDYELALEVCNDPSVEAREYYDSLLAGLRVRGWSFVRDDWSKARGRLVPMDMRPGVFLYSCLELEGRGVVPLGVQCYEVGDDRAWLRVLLPLGGLGMVFPVGGLPFGGRGDWDWMWELDEVLARVGRRVYERTRFLMGIIGHEVCGTLTADNVVGSTVAEGRSFGLLIPRGGGVDYLPRTALG
jgi:hypothetical protein